MKKAMLALVVTMFALGTVACGPSLEDAFSDVEESAPSLCKEFCEEQTNCEFDDDDFDGDSADIDKIFNNSVQSCITDCAYPMAEGTFIGSVSDNEVEVERWVSGGEYENYMQCMANIWADFDDDFLRCNDDEIFELRFDDEDVCEAMEECHDSLDDLDIDCTWEDSLGFCSCDHDNWLADGLYF